MSQSLIRLRLGTRGSKLALRQSETVRTLLEEHSGIVCDLVILKTTGDRIQDRPLADLGGKGLFTKELEEALLRREIDLAVHSMKDVPTIFPKGLGIAAILPREDPRDAFISSRASALEELPAGARVGTSSVRRQALVRRVRPDLKTALLRGNVDTRLQKAEAGEFDAIILALAGLRRLGLEDRVTKLMDTRNWLPALGQGAIGIEIRDEDIRTKECVARLEHLPTATALACERAFQAALDGTCRTPIGGLASVEGTSLRFHGEVLAPDGSDSLEARFEILLGDDPKADAARAGRKAGEELRPRASRWLAL